MPRHLAALLALCLAAIPAAAATLAERPAVTAQELQAGFADPPMAYAPFTFWFWDEPLNPAKMAQMARTMASQRLNPGYAHPRTTGPGVSPPNPLPVEQWLSPLWFEAFGAALTEAEGAGQYLGYCDEYMWPSFQAAGRILAQNPDLAALSLDWRTLEVPPGGTVQVPESLFAVAARRQDPPPAVSADQPPAFGAWIWQPQPGTGRHECCLRKTFDLPAAAAIVSGRARLSADNRFVLFVNGTEIGRGADWHAPGEFDLAAALQPGANTITVIGGGDGGLDAMTFGLRVRLGGGQTVDVLSDSTWQVIPNTAPGSPLPDAGDPAWVPVRVIASDPAAPPWGLSPAGPHQPATILASTLRLLSEGPSVSWTAPAEGDWRVYVFSLRRHGFPSYIDHRLREAFIPIAHEPYAAIMGDRMGTSIPGVFVDNEGQYGWRLAWSQDLAERYRQRWGRDIRLWMPLMVDPDVEGVCGRARWEWFEVVSDLYAETMGSVSDWLAARGMYAISNLWEESLQWQAAMVGDFFKLTRAYTMPGNDCLGRKALEVHDFKEVSSVCEFEGRRFMSEVLGAGGWGDFTPTFLKQSANAVIAWGVGHVVPHGIFTNRNLENAQWTPDWYDENPMFPSLHLWTDFLRRACYMNSHGRQAADVLLLSPMDSVWAEAASSVFDPSAPGDLGGVDGAFGPRVALINQVYSRAIEALTRDRIEFLVADRYYLRQMQVTEGRLVREDLSIGAVVLPPMDVLPLDVARLLLQFAAAGGHVYALGELPQGSAEVGLRDPAMVACMDQLAALPTFTACQGLDDLGRHVAAGDPGLERQVRFTSGEFEMLQRHVRTDGRDAFWLVNNGLQWRQSQALFAACAGVPVKWDCETGERHLIPFSATPDGPVCDLTFRPLEGFWVVFEDAARAPSPEAADDAPIPVATLAGPWTVRFPADQQPTVQFPTPIPAELTAGAVRPLQPWSAWGLERFSGVADYTTTFEAPADLAGPCSLDLGAVLFSARAWLNDEPLGDRLWGPHVFDLTGRLRPGANTLRVRVAGLINNSYGDLRPTGLLGPVRLMRGHSLAAPSGRTAIAPRGEPVPLADPTADHSQPGFSVADILDPDTAGWGAWDATLREPVAQTAVVHTVSDVGTPGAGTELTFTLAHAYAPPAGLLLGRFRLSATTDPRDTFADGKPNGGRLSANWTVLSPESVIAEQGTPLTVLPDGSVLAMAAAAATDTYYVTCRTDLAGITGFRIEALEDPALPRKPGGVTEGGPGLTANEGNFTLTWFAVHQRPVAP